VAARAFVRVACRVADAGSRHLGVYLRSLTVLDDIRANRRPLSHLCREAISDAPGLELNLRDPLYRPRLHPTKRFPDSILPLPTPSDASVFVA
jgi:hypothetical protein